MTEVLSTFGVAFLFSFIGTIPPWDTEPDCDPAWVEPQDRRRVANGPCGGTHRISVCVDRCRVSGFPFTVIGVQASFSPDIRYCYGCAGGDQSLGFREGFNVSTAFRGKRIPQRHCTFAAQPIGYTFLDGNDRVSENLWMGQSFRSIRGSSVSHRCMYRNAGIVNERRFSCREGCELLQIR